MDSMIAEHGGSSKTMGEVFDKERAKIGEARARVEGCNSSVTFLRDNMLKYSMVLNLLTGETFVASPMGLFSGDITIAKTHEDLTDRLQFHSDENQTALYYCEGPKYVSNREGTHLKFFPAANIEKSGGPNRFTYLLVPKHTDPNYVNPVGFIAHNGEKIQESLPNIVFALYSGGELKAFKLFCDLDHQGHRGGKPLTPNLANSIYDHGLIMQTGVDLRFLNRYEYPSEFRDTTVIAPAKNAPVVNAMVGMIADGYAIRIV
jgi:hypothetical protein